MANTAKKKTKNAQGLFRQPTVEYWLDGRRVTKNTPGAERKRKLSKKWYCKVKDGTTGQWKAVPLSTDLGVAKKMRAQLILGGEEGRAGLIDPLAKHKGDLVRDYFDSFKEYMRDVQGDGDRHIADTVRLVEAILDGCEITTISDLQSCYEKVSEFLVGLDVGPRTKNMYRGAVIFFCKYLTSEKKRLKQNPLEALPVRPTPKAEARRRRRALPLDQLQKFVEVVRTRPLDNARTATQKRKARPSKTLCNIKPKHEAALLLKGRERALIYAVAASTGFREGELSDMLVGDLSLEGPQPFIRLTGDRTKNSQDAVVPLSPEMAAALKDWVADTGKKPADLLFRVPNYSTVMRNWKKDLAAAGIPYQDGQGRYFDFHSLRKCLGSFLRLAGVDPAMSMKMMRHSTIRLTMEVYNDDQLIDLHRVVESLPQLKVG